MIFVSFWIYFVLEKIYIKMLAGGWYNTKAVNTKDVDQTAWVLKACQCLCCSNMAFEPRHEKTCLQDFRPGKTQTCTATETR